MVLEIVQNDFIVPQRIFFSHSAVGNCKKVYVNEILEEDTIVRCNNRILCIALANLKPFHSHN